MEKVTLVFFGMQCDVTLMVSREGKSVTIRDEDGLYWHGHTVSFAWACIADCFSFCVGHIVIDSEHGELY